MYRTTSLVAQSQTQQVGIELIMIVILTANTHTYIDSHPYIHTYIHTYIPTHIHTYTHTYTYT